jgi:hypothetical protein
MVSQRRFEGVRSMKLHLTLAATAAVLAAAFASPALAIEQVHIPDSSAADNSGPPDALFDKSIPTTWQQKQNAESQQNGMGGFHFSVNGGNAYQQQQNSSGFGENAQVPGSEFHGNNGVALDPNFAPPPH